MNRSQKIAWFNLAGGLLYVAIHAWVIARVVILKTIPGGFERFWHTMLYGKSQCKDVSVMKNPCNL
jgi:hypothetical protein